MVFTFTYMPKTHRFRVPAGLSLSTGHAPVHSVRLSRRGVGLDAFKSATAKHYKDRDTLVFCIPLASSTANYRRQSWYRLRLSVVSCSRSGHYDRHRRQYAVARITAVSGCFAVLCQIRSIRRSVSVSVFTSLVVSHIMPRLHYGNAD